LVLYILFIIEGKKEEKWREIEEEEVRSYCMTLRKQEHIGKLKRKH
jgi:hypothetical protein